MQNQPAGDLGSGWGAGACPVPGTHPPYENTGCSGPVLTLPFSSSPQKWLESRVTSIDDSDPWWAAFSGVFKDMCVSWPALLSPFPPSFLYPPSTTLRPFPLPLPPTSPFLRLSPLQEPHPGARDLPRRHRQPLPPRGEPLAAEWAVRGPRGLAFPLTLLLAPVGRDPGSGLLTHEPHACASARPRRATA